MQTYRQQHESEYKEFEARGKDFASSLDGVATLLDPKNPSHFENRGSRGANPDQPLRTVLGETLLGVVNDWVGFEKKLGAAALDAAAKAAAANPERAADFIDKLKQNSAVFGANADRFKAVVTDIDALRTAGIEAEFNAARAKLQKSMQDAGDFAPADSALGQSLRALAVVNTSVSVFNGWKGWNEAALQQRVRTITDTVGLTAAGTETVFGALNATKGASVAGSQGAAAFGRFAGGATGFVGAVHDGFNAADAFKRGDVTRGLASSASAAGGLILAGFALAGSTPVAGQIIGAVLIAAGAGLNQYANVQEANRYEASAKERLQLAGLSPNLADKLANHSADGQPPGPVLVELSKRSRVPMDQLLRFLDSLPEDKLDQFIDEGVTRVTRNDKGEPELHNRDINDLREWKSYIWQYPSSVDGLIVWMEKHDVLPPGAKVPPPDPNL